MKTLVYGSENAIVQSRSWGCYIFLFLENKRVSIVCIESSIQVPSGGHRIHPELLIWSANYQNHVGRESNVSWKYQSFSASYLVSAFFFFSPSAQKRAWVFVNVFPLALRQTHRIVRWYFFLFFFNNNFYVYVFSSQFMRTCVRACVFLRANWLGLLTVHCIHSKHF